MIGAIFSGSDLCSELMYRGCDDFFCEDPGGGGGWGCNLDELMFCPPIVPPILPPGGGGGGGGSRCGDKACPPPPPPPPPPTPSCSAELHYRPVRFTGGSANHAFWIVNDSIENWVLEGGPNKGLPFDVIGLTHLTAWWSNPPATLPHFTADTAETPIWESSEGGGICFEVSIMTAQTQAFNADNGTGIRYNPFFGPNSNSFAHSLGKLGGFSVSFPPPRTPG